MNIVAIGGGDRTPAIKRALELTGETSPTALIIPTAASTQASFDKKVGIYKATFDKLGVASEVLHEFNQKPSADEIAHKIGTASLLYTFGGNTPYMIRKMAEHGTTTAVGNAIRDGKLHAGLSAGALLPFRYALSNPSAKPGETEWDFELVEPGINAIDAAVTAHADAHDPTPYGERVDSRTEALMTRFPKQTHEGYAISNNATAILGDNPEILTLTPDAYVQYLSRDSKGNITARPAELSDLKK
jgi:peptidase E